VARASKGDFLLTNWLLGHPLLRALLSKTLFAIVPKNGNFDIGPLKIVRRKIVPISTAVAARSASHYPESDAIHSKVEFFASAQAVESRRVFPALSTWKIRDAVVKPNRRTNIVITKHAGLVAPRSEPGPWRTYWGHSSPVTGGIWGQQGGEFLQLSAKTRFETEPSAIFVGALSPHNWYHWLCQTLPTLYLSRALAIPESVPLVLHAGTFPDNKWRESFDLMDIRREILFIDDDDTLLVDELYWTDAPVDRGPFAQSLQHPVSIHGPAFRDFQNYLLEKVPVSSPGQAKTPKKVMLIRSQGATRPYNQEEIVAIASEYGFVSIALESLSFQAVVNLFRGAERIIGPHGASFANIMFCAPGTKVLQWQAKDSTAVNDYSSLAVCCGLDFRVIPSQQVDGNDGVGGQQWLDPTVARREISALQ
jgi:hypothetical protein